MALQVTEMMAALNFMVAAMALLMATMSVWNKVEKNRLGDRRPLRRT